LRNSSDHTLSPTLVSIRDQYKQAVSKLCGNYEDYFVAILLIFPLQARDTTKKACGTGQFRRLENLRADS
jgi:hypothetical protein